MKHTFILKAIILPIGILLSACTKPENNSNTYDRGALYSAQRTIVGKILSKRTVTVKGGSGLGSTAGAGLGASVGGKSGDQLSGAIAGAVIGGTVGAALENEALKTEAYEYIVESKVAGILTMVMTDNSFKTGDDVFIVLGKVPKLIKKPN